MIVCSRSAAAERGRQVVRRSLPLPLRMLGGHRGYRAGPGEVGDGRNVACCEDFGMAGDR
jgi:hypothetical protein